MTRTATTKVYRATLDEARDKRVRAWGVFYTALGDGTSIDLLRAFMYDWLRADTAVKRLIGWNVMDDKGEIA